MPKSWISKFFLWFFCPDFGFSQKNHNYCVGICMFLTFLCHYDIVGHLDGDIDVVTDVVFAQQAVYIGMLEGFAYLGHYA